MPKKYRWIFFMVLVQGLLMIYSLNNRVMVKAGAALFIGAVIFLLLTLIDLKLRRKKDPGWFDAQYFVFVLLLFAYMCIIHALLLFAGSKLREWNHIFILVYGIFVILLGNFTPRLPFKSLMGIWIPWIFKSEPVWRRAHRLAGFIYSAFGILFILLILVDLRINDTLTMVLFYIAGPIIVASIIPGILALAWMKKDQTGLEKSTGEEKNGT